MLSLILMALRWDRGKLLLVSCSGIIRGNILLMGAESVSPRSSILVAEAWGMCEGVN